MTANYFIRVPITWKVRWEKVPSFVWSLCIKQWAKNDWLRILTFWVAAKWNCCDCISADSNRIQLQPVRKTI